MIITTYDILKQEVQVEEVCKQIHDNLDYSSRLQLIHLLFWLSTNIRRGRLQIRFFMFYTKIIVRKNLSRGLSIKSKYQLSLQSISVGN